MLQKRKLPFDQQQGQEPQPGADLQQMQPFQPLATTPAQNLVFPEESPQVGRRSLSAGPQGFNVNAAEQNNVPFGPMDPDGRKGKDITSLLQKLLSGSRG